ENNNPDFNTLKKAFKNIANILKKGDIVVLETSVPPTTTEIIVRKWLEEGSKLKLGDFYLANSPERIMTGFSISRLREFPKIIGGVDNESGKKAFDMYKLFIPNLQFVSSARVAEFIKIIEGIYRDTNIALANELYKISDELKINFVEARELANHEFCNIHSPSTGTGGHCIPVYPWFLLNEMEKRNKNQDTKLIRISREINEDMIKFWAKKIIQKTHMMNSDKSKVKVCINGITYREGVKELHHSRNLALARLLIEKGINIVVYDELLTKDEIQKLGLKWSSPKDADIVFDTFNLNLSIT
ncbi:nucleotide sugar dehydrogenase, partial [Thermoproteota archaeon]